MKTSNEKDILKRAFPYRRQLFEPKFEEVHGSVERNRYCGLPPKLEAKSALTSHARVAGAVDQLRVVGLVGRHGVVSDKAGPQAAVVALPARLAHTPLCPQRIVPILGSETVRGGRLQAHLNPKGMQLACNKILMNIHAQPQGIF